MSDSGRLVVIDTVAELGELLPLHAWSALVASDRILLRGEDHPFSTPLRAAELEVRTLAHSSADPAPIVDLATQGGGDTAVVVGPHDDEGFLRALAMAGARAGLEVEFVYVADRPRGLRLLTVVQTMARLRAPGGCPWDREQTHASLARYVTEEAAELVEAIAGGEDAALADELGDVLLQVLFHAAIAEQDGRFTVDGVADRLHDKLLRRHPHVFAGVAVADADEVVTNWRRIKAEEKPDRGPLDGLSPGQPALAYAAQLLRRAAKAKLTTDAAGTAAAPTTDAERVGEALLSIVRDAVATDIDPELALRQAVQRARERLEAPLKAPLN